MNTIKDMGICASLSATFVLASTYVGIKAGIAAANHLANPLIAQAIAEHSLPASAMISTTFVSLMIGQSDAEAHKKKAAIYGAAMICGGAFLSFIGGDKIVEYPDRTPIAAQVDTVGTEEVCNSYANAFFKPAMCP